MCEQWATMPTAAQVFTHRHTVREFRDTLLFATLSIQGVFSVPVHQLSILSKCFAGREMGSLPSGWTEALEESVFW